MRMYIANERNLTQLKQDFPNYLYVSISRGDEHCDAHYSNLVPDTAWLRVFRDTHTEPGFYEKCYNAQLAKLSPEDVFMNLKEIALKNNKKAIVIVGFDKFNTWGHKNLVANWYNKLGCNVKELVPKETEQCKAHISYSWKETEPIKGSLKIINNEYEANAVLNSSNVYGKIIMLYTGWSEQTTRALAKRYCSGTTVQIGDTEIKSKRYPRPYIKNWTEEQQIAVKRMQTEQNNKTCYEFIKEVGYVLAKAYNTKPYDLTLAYNTGYKIKNTVQRDKDNIPRIIKIAVPTVPTQLQNAHYELEMHDLRFPQTRSLAQLIEGVEKALDEMSHVNNADTTNLQTDINIRRALYAEDLDYNKYSVTRLVAPTKEFIDSVSDKPDPNDTQAQKKKNKKFYVSVTEDVITYDYGYRTTTYNGERTVSKSPKTYASDVKTTVSTEKIQECKEVLDWLEQHDMLDLHAYKCPNCGHTANTSMGCEHCGYDLPKQAREHFNKGRLSLEELSNMTTDEINKIFSDIEEDASYEEWRTKSLNVIY